MNQSNVDDSWLANLSDTNLLAVIDVLTDARDELQLHGPDFQIPILPSVLRFSDLMPADSPNLRDRYGRMRYLASTKLEEQGVFHHVSTLGTGHRWEMRIAGTADLGLVIATLDRLNSLPRMKSSIRKSTIRSNSDPRMLLISALSGALAATMAFLILDFVTPLQTRHWLETSIGTGTLLLIGTFLWPIVQNILGSAAWDALRERLIHK